MAVNPFEALGVEPVFSLDLAVLEQRHRDMSRALHPDRHAASGAGERRMALGRAIEVNEAYRILKDPVRRAEALLALRGVRAGEGNEPPASPALLMEVMERRESLAEVRQTKNEIALNRLIDEVRGQASGVEAALAREFASPSSNSAEILKRMGELRYYRRFLDEAASIADDLL
ncbi:MAG TPA: Fe-S protein assembly co-chaperone HscB [Polyangiaceae bacterium]|nr:Fe-S protein assembly co-chaperone HscB [Polyangiaceae bacterium]